MTVGRSKAAVECKNVYDIRLWCYNTKVWTSLSHYLI